MARGPNVCTCTSYATFPESAHALLKLTAKALYVILYEPLAYCATSRTSFQGLNRYFVMSSPSTSLKGKLQYIAPP